MRGFFTCLPPKAYSRTVEECCLSTDEYYVFHKARRKFWKELGITYHIRAVEFLVYILAPVFTEHISSDLIICPVVPQVPALARFGRRALWTAQLWYDQGQLCFNQRPDLGGDRTWYPSIHAIVLSCNLRTSVVMTARPVLIENHVFITRHVKQLPEDPPVPNLSRYDIQFNTEQCLSS